MQSIGQFVHKLLSTQPYDAKVVTVFTGENVSSRALAEQILTEERKLQIIQIDNGEIPAPRQLPQLMGELVELGYIVMFNLYTRKDLEALTGVLAGWKSIPQAHAAGGDKLSGQIFIHLNGLERDAIPDDFIKLVDYWAAQPQTALYV